MKIRVLLGTLMVVLLSAFSSVKASAHDGCGHDSWGHCGYHASYCCGPHGHQSMCNHYYGHSRCCGYYNNWRPRYRYMCGHYYYTACCSSHHSHGCGDGCKRHCDKDDRNDKDRD